MASRVNVIICQSDSVSAVAIQRGGEVVGFAHYAVEPVFIAHADGYVMDGPVRHVCKIQRTLAAVANDSARRARGESSAMNLMIYVLDVPFAWDQLLACGQAK